MPLVVRVGFGEGEGGRVRRGVEVIGDAGRTPCPMASPPVVSGVIWWGLNRTKPVTNPILFIWLVPMFPMMFLFIGQ